MNNDTVTRKVINVQLLLLVQRIPIWMKFPSLPSQEPSDNDGA